MSVVFLVLAVVLAGGGAWTMVRAYRRDDSLRSMLGLLLIIAAGIPGAVFGTLDS